MPGVSLRSSLGVLSQVHLGMYWGLLGVSCSLSRLSGGLCEPLGASWVPSCGLGRRPPSVGYCSRFVPCARLADTEGLRHANRELSNDFLIVVHVYVFIFFCMFLSCFALFCICFIVFDLFCMFLNCFVCFLFFCLFYTALFKTVVSRMFSYLS